MISNMDLWALLGAGATLLSAFFTGLWAVGRLLLRQIEARLDTRFNAMEQARNEAGKHWDEKFLALEKAATTNEKEWRNVERKLLEMKADIPINYVRREDYTRNQSIIEAKIDGLAMRIENAVLKGGKND